MTPKEEMLEDQKQANLEGRNPNFQWVGNGIPGKKAGMYKYENGKVVKFWEPKQWKMEK